MKVVIIGGTGNISSEVAAALYQKGNSITVVTTGKRPVPPLYTHIRADRNNTEEFKKALAGIESDCVIDFFAFVPDHLKVDYEIFKGRTGQFIFISSATVYEKPHKKIPITEQTPLGNPFWHYAQDKIRCEEYLWSVNSPLFPVTIVRPSHTFGNQWIPSPLCGNDFTVAQRILDGRPIIIHDRGESLWTLTAASDFAAGLGGLAGNLNAIGEAFHITSDEALSWNKIYQILGATLGREPVVEYIPSKALSQVYPEARGALFGDKKENGVFDNSKIKKFVPGFSCKKTFVAAIRESVEWFMQEPVRRAVNPEQDRFIDRLIEMCKPHSI
ncbi:MAG: NAD-dependent epimerase/dehydratase family protein [Fibrobacter sp.]|jgi:nucleoside-diphosphate-sugar epimerase|nr:NAD-dependent epimerase/dehydratase family protein [Fibrobacter sp.]